MTPDETTNLTNNPVKYRKAPRKLAKYLKKALRMLLWSVLAIISIFTVFFAILFIMSFTSSATSKYCWNTSISQKRALFNQTLNKSAPTKTGGKFGNPWPTSKVHGFTDLIAWKRKYVPEDEKDYNEKLKKDIEQKKLDVSGFGEKIGSLNDYLNVGKYFDSGRLLEKVEVGEVRVTWLGHASSLIQFSGGFNVLTDPVFSERASPSQLMGPKRNSRVPISISKLHSLGVDIHAVLISHNHYDHLDLNTLQQVQKYYKKATIYSPLNTNQNTIKATNSVELGWWDSSEFENEEGVVARITLTPAQHWTKRSAFDDNKSLWGGFIIQSANTTAFFAGDTGYCQVFEEIGQTFPDITVALIPIGAYLPRWFMNPQHISPEEAVQVYKDLKCRNGLAIHWLSFDLADDRGLEPVEELEFFKEDFGESSGFVVKSVGESCDFR